MVSPCPVDVEVTRGVAVLVETKLLHDAETGRVLGPDRDLDAVEPDLEQAVVDRHGDGDRDEPLPGMPLVDPVADLTPPRRATHDVADRELPYELVVDGDREGQRTTGARLTSQVSDHRPKAGGG